MACFLSNSSAIVTKMEKISPIKRACDAVGGQSRLAATLSITPAAVHQWVRGIRRVPTDRCADIEKATEGAVTCEELRPDKLEYWMFLRGSRVKNSAPESSQEAA
jgi:DNA-binding transcriptional regulator YdaS (Cro superfamily)